MNNNRFRTRDANGNIGAPMDYKTLASVISIMTLPNSLRRWAATATPNSEYNLGGPFAIECISSQKPATLPVFDLSTAHDLALRTTGNLTLALESAGAVESIVMLRLIEDAAQLARDIDQLRAAVVAQQS